jgi:hypothetical protein
MSKLILLDAGLLGLVSNPNTSAEAESCREWVHEREFLGDLIVITEIAEEFWAQARQTGKQTASDQALDADMILAAQASLLIENGDAVVIATTNPKHLSLFVPAARWQDIA